MPEPATARQTAAPFPRRTAVLVLAVLTFINLFNYLDRYVVPGVGDLLSSALHLTDKEFSLLTTVFFVVYALAAPRFGRQGDTASRPRAIAFGVALWSVATVLGGLASGFVSLLIARSLVGVGEAAYASIAPSMLADAFPAERRGRVFAVFYAAIPIGSALGYMIAGFMGTHFGWRSAFFVAGVPGVLPALWLLRLPDPPRGAQDGPPPRHAAPTGRGLAHFLALFRNGPYRATVLGYAAYTFAFGGLAVFMPMFLSRVRGVPLNVADQQIGIAVVVTGFVGTYAGGWLGDFLLRYTRNAYLLMSGVATLLAAPCAWIALTSTDHAVYYASLVAAELLLFLSTGPINSAIVSYVSPTERATAMAFSILLIHLLGDVPSPYIVGAISDARRAAGATPAAGLQIAVMVLPVAILISGMVWTAAAFTRSAHRVGPPEPVGT